MNSEVKKLVDNMCGFVDGLAKAVDIKDDLATVSRLEIGMYMMYLSAADGKITWEEARDISEICKLDLTPSNIGQFIKEKGIYSTSFEQTVPTCFKLVCAADKAMRQGGQKMEHSGAEMLLTTFAAVGAEIVKGDGNVADNEVRDYKIYLSMLESYVNANL